MVAKNPAHIPVPLIGIHRDAEWAILKQAGKGGQVGGGMRWGSKAPLQNRWRPPFLTFAMYVFMRCSSQFRQEHVELSVMYGPDTPGHFGVVAHPSPQAYGSFPSGSSPPFRCAKEERGVCMLKMLATSQHATTQSPAAGAGFCMVRLAVLNLRLSADSCTM